MSTTTSTTDSTYLCLAYPHLFESTYHKAVEHYFPGQAYHGGYTLGKIIHKIALFRSYGSVPSTMDTTKYADSIRDKLRPQLAEGRRVTAPRLIRLIEAEVTRLLSDLGYTGEE